LLLGIGWLLGWLAKRILVRVFIALRFDRPLHRLRWGAPLARADVRHAFYNSFGNLGFFVVFLVFLNAALEVLNLNVISEVIQRGILFIPRLLICLGIAGLGWGIAGRVALGIQRALIKEQVPSATLIARFSKTVVFLFFSAMALAELNVARQIVIIGFSAAIITLGIISVVLTMISGQALVHKLIAKPEEE
jgi:hypothetical protein